MVLFPPAAPLVSDFVAIFEIGVALVLLTGAFVVRRGHVRAHKYMQSAMVLVNIPIVLSWMIPRYIDLVWPRLESNFTNDFYWIPTIMLIIGAAAEALGLYIILAAGTEWLPIRFRLQRYKPWMRTELVLWWLVVITGLSTYYVWYVPH